MDLAFILYQFLALNCCVLVFLELQFNAAFTMIKVVRVFNARPTAAIVGAFLVRFGRQVFYLPEQCLIVCD